MLFEMTRFMQPYLMLLTTLLLRSKGGERMQPSAMMVVTSRWRSPALRRSVVALLLTVVIALTGQSMAVARGASTPTGEMILCTGSGPTAILVDAEGNPTGPSHYCPDCVMSLMDVVAIGIDLPVYEAIAGKTPGIASPLYHAGSDQPIAQARGPPITI